MNRPLRVLNLEDNVPDAELNHAMISARWPDCQFVRVDNRDNFLAALDEDHLDIILSDYTMPGFSGQGALRLARDKRPEVPFVFVSGTIGEDTAIEALKGGAADYVLKHRLMRLIPAVDRALRDVRQLAEYKRAEEQMRQSEHKYRELFESLEDAAFLTHEQSGKIIDVNRRAEEWLECSRRAILGRKHSEFLTTGGIISETTNPASLAESRLIRSNGTSIPVNVHVTKLALYGQALALRLCRAQPG